MRADSALCGSPDEVRHPAGVVRVVGIPSSDLDDGLRTCWPRQHIPVRWADNLVSHVRLTLLSFAAPFAITGIVSTFRQERRASHLPPGLVGHLVTFVLAGCLFWTLVGHIVLQLTLTHYPAVIVALGYACCRKCQRPLAWIAVSLVAQIVFFAMGVYE